MAAQREAFDDKHSGHDPSTKDIACFTSKFHFPTLPILRGDASLAEDFVIDINVQIKRHSIVSLNDPATIAPFATILFHLIIIRTYLERRETHDLDIYHMAKSERFKRIWTTHELALAACNGEYNTSPTAEFSTTPCPGLWGIRVTYDPDLKLTESQGFVRIIDEHLVRWSDDDTFSLTGGNRRPRFYRPPQLRLAAALGPRPTPRRVLFVPPEKNVNLSGATTRGSTYLERELEPCDVVEKPVKKRRVTPAGKSDRSQGPLRRSARIDHFSAAK